MCCICPMNVLFNSTWPGSEKSVDQSESRVEVRRQKIEVEMMRCPQLGRDFETRRAWFLFRNLPTHSWQHEDLTVSEKIPGPKDHPKTQYEDCGPHSLRVLARLCIQLWKGNPHKVSLSHMPKLIRKSRMAPFCSRKALPQAKKVGDMEGSNLDRVLPDFVLGSRNIRDSIGNPLKRVQPLKNRTMSFRGRIPPCLKNLATVQVCLPDDGEVRGPREWVTSKWARLLVTGSLHGPCLAERLGHELIRCGLFFFLAGHVEFMYPCLWGAL